MTKHYYPVKLHPHTDLLPERGEYGKNWRPNKGKTARKREARMARRAAAAKSVKRA